MAAPVASAEVKRSTVDPALAQAVASASARALATSPDQAGPPPNGVFLPGAADREMPPGSAPRITLGNAGSEPRILLSPAVPSGGARGELRARLSLASAGRGGLPLDFRLAIEPVRRADRREERAEQPMDYVARILQAGVDQSQVASVDDKLKAQLGRLRGSKVLFKLEASGAGRDFSVQLSPGADPSLIDTLRALSELLATVLLPYPDQPVGAGAYWMATTRETVVGIDTVAYRLVTVQKVQGDTLLLKIDSKRYAASNAAPAVQGLPSDSGEVRLEQFKSVGEGTMTVARGHVLPTEGRLNHELLAILSMARRPGQPAVLQTQLTALLSRP